MNHIQGIPLYNYSNNNKQISIGVCDTRIVWNEAWPRKLDVTCISNKPIGETIVLGENEKRILASAGKLKLYAGYETETGWYYWKYSSSTKTYVLVYR